MLGPVLYQEMLLGGRRSRWHIVRWLYAAWLVIQLSFWMFVFMTVRSNMEQRPADVTLLADFSRDYLNFLSIQHFLVLILVTPVLVAGSITDEKWRGTLQYLLTADLLPFEILTGKLFGRMYQGILLALVAFPMFCFMAPFGGIDPLRVALFCYISVLLLFLLGSVSLLASVWCRHTRDAVLSVYSFGALFVFLMFASASLLKTWTGVNWPMQIARCFNFLIPLGNDWTSSTVPQLGRKIFLLTLIWGGIGLVSFSIAVLRLRAAYIRQLESSGKSKRRLPFLQLRRPVVGNRPLLWKERWVEGIAPLAILRQVPTWFGVIVVFLLTTASSLSILIANLPVNFTPGKVFDMFVTLDWWNLLKVLLQSHVSGREFYTQGYVMMMLAGLVVGIRCSGAVTGERERATWEALLLTPLTTQELIRGKAWGIAGASIPYLIAYSIPALAFAIVGGVASFLWTLLWIGVTLLAIFYVACAGIWCSVRSKTSWRSLFLTLAFTYLGGFVLFCMLSGVAFIIAIFILLMLSAIDSLLQRYFNFDLGAAGFAASYWNAWQIAFCIALALAFVILSWMLLRGAEYRVGILERTKHWKNERATGRRRRRRRSHYRID